MNKHEYVGDFGDDFVLVQWDREVKEILESIGKPELVNEYDCLFVKVGDGEFEEIYGVPGMPTVGKLVDKIYPEEADNVESELQ